jgi:hypothetical protein
MLFCLITEKLTLAGRRNTRETAEGIFVYVGNKLVELSRRNPGTEVHQGFVKQGCTDGMGMRHLNSIYITSLFSAINGTMRY